MVTLSEIYSGNRLKGTCSHRSYLDVTPRCFRFPSEETGRRLDSNTAALLFPVSCNLGVCVCGLCSSDIMSALCRSLSLLSFKTLAAAPVLSPCSWFMSTRSKFTKARIPKELFAERSKEHEKYGGDPDQPHKLHIVMRVKSVKRRPYWEKEMVKHLGLEKAQTPVIHKNSPAVNHQLKFVKHLLRIQPLKTPYGLPAEQDMAETYINTKGELIVRRLLQPVDPKAIES
ncbi:large ribosomal subunit protein uL30m [Parambassis ranga]|uniref:Large ribosomal subunit protein uL30m n=1 Tax=Parambassis ranga TaxID=210632 RepID=A0A6P7HK10_9TELE|nr:39S ribosomal protein L30, mitochondrial [Parambassis ranga]